VALKLRHPSSVLRPGITCLWQINGRSTISFEKWMELDMEYIDKKTYIDLMQKLGIISKMLFGLARSLK
jgi:lipopolysaccharide/colanic/teichoic acid biosynthesis glycosyltransferase